MNQQQSVRDVQMKILDIMKYIDSVCRRNGIVYYIMGGTALGAVRHGGFIPWDDDIDIGMRRKDYEKFLKVVQKELPEGYHVQNFYTEPNTPVIVLENGIDITNKVTITTKIEGPSNIINTSVEGTYKITYTISYNGFNDTLVKTIQIKNS